MPPVDEEAEARAKHWQAVRFAIAVENGDMETVQQEIEEGWIPTYKMTEGSTWSVLSIAANCGQMEMAETFTGRGKNPKVDEKDANGFQALMLAALSGHHDICKLLIDKKAEVNCQDATGETPLMKAAAQGHLECVKILLTSNADPDTEDCNTISAIRKAAKWGHVECLKELLPKVKDDPGQLKHCLLFGKLNGHQGVVDVMTKVLEPEKAGEALEDAQGTVATAGG
eukprot:TRINITY_DN18260_c0_g1_i2.p1 TRINITY_DN18260_c0_g1~~TRINITY_DN18260_c0_g1_i2.p1  ORF type:complete len:256 (-),score=47.45 TRINITY_DN18260_c0_g1_i2:100-780(-)